MIVWLSFILLALTAWHIIYDYMILPVLRDKLRFKLFAIRDEMRDLKYRKPHEFTNHAFMDAQLLINASINNANSISVISLIESHRKLKRHPKLKEALKQDILTLMNSDSEVSAALNKTLDVLQRAVVVNTGGNFPYLLPFIFAYCLIWSLFKEVIIPFIIIIKSIITNLSMSNLKLKLVRQNHLSTTILIRSSVIGFLDTKSDIKLDKLHHSFIRL